jgi:hypothetical protein
MAMTESNAPVPMPEPVKLQLQKVILPIIATANDGGFHPIGTGFIICAIGREAIMLSAAHNFTEITRIDRPYDWSHPTTPNEFRLPRQDNVVLRWTRMQALYRDSEGKGHFALIRNVYINNPCDVAVCTLQFEDQVPPIVHFDSKIAIDTAPTKKGRSIIAAGYSEMQVLHHNVDYDANTAVTVYHQKLEWRHGQITSVYPSCGPRNQPWPCFQCDTPFDSGMSGGPIIDKTHGDLIVACGVVCSDSTSEASRMQAGSGRDAIASMLWPSMGIAIKEAMLGGVVGEVKLLDLQQRNFVDDKGNASEHISFVPGTRINDCQMIWR